MKILRITLCNIASLSGTQTVDFTRDPLRSAGLFSISGPTGAGKSTLLDALCLALYDAIPRLQQVGRLVELANGEKQNDPRMLLRRGAGEGFAEVAFVGVDGQTWTSRWSVRRSRRSSDGALQNVEMVLYRGQIRPGGEGPVAEGVKKTQVLKAIEEKIGLTFQQFTRAVLLAQNDFATFLKADDKERAEILQALTGTEVFESISRAVFTRCADEKRTVETLESQLRSNLPLAAEKRIEAEKAYEIADGAFRASTERLKIRQSHADWHEKLASLIGGQGKADEHLSQMLARRDEAAPRRMELDLTEAVCRNARPLRSTMLQAERDIDDANQEHTTALQSQTELVAALKDAQTNFEVVESAKKEVLAEQERIKPLLAQARQLDMQLALAQQQSEQTQESVDSAKQACQIASDKLECARKSKTSLLHEQEKLQRECQALTLFEPFVADAALWLERIKGAIAARNEFIAVSDTRQRLSDHLGELSDRLESERHSRAALESQFNNASAELNAALAAAAHFNPDQLASERAQFDENHQVLIRFKQQLTAVQQQNETKRAIVGEISSLEEEQAKKSKDLEELSGQILPSSRSTFEAAKSQLKLIQAAVDDHAQRLRLTLQSDTECPVCGSTSHPYRDHAPVLEATVVKVARESVDALEAKLNDVRAEIAGLEATIANRSETIRKQKLQLSSLEESLVEVAFESQDHCDVAAILALAGDERIPAVEAKLDAISGALKAIVAQEQSQRTAAKQVDACRRVEETSRNQLEQLDNTITDLEKQHGPLKEKTDNAAALVLQSEQRAAESMTVLRELWKGWPSARSEFEQNAEGFLESFENCVTECGHIKVRIGKLSSQIAEVDAAVVPLQETFNAAQEMHKECDTALGAASKEYDQVRDARAKLLEGQPVEFAELELNERFNQLSKAFEDATSVKAKAESNVAIAFEKVSSRSKALQNAQTHHSNACSSMDRWLSQFCASVSRTITLFELDEMLARDDAWLNSERQALKELSDDVKTAEGVSKAHATLVQQHRDQQPTQDDQAKVFADLKVLKSYWDEAGKTLEEARVVIANDDRLRETNLTLAEQLEQQRKQAEPWLKLNDLIGSADGAKFRMIAQRRTLDLLLRYANHQLHHLAHRYRLERLPESLNLIVVDCDMGGDRRSIHSLSGGESFLASLALALGLASLTSNRLRVESLFIDEGFGSLDPETLNIAMGALMQLEAQGRKVGVISHVTEMTDAIPVQIKIVKGRGGSSRIVVPGASAEEVSYAGEPEVAIALASLSDPTCLEGIASQMLSILQREHARGKEKVSSRALREEVGCDVELFKAAQSALGGQIVADGRSLRISSAQAECS